MRRDMRGSVEALQGIVAELRDQDTRYEYELHLVPSAEHSTHPVMNLENPAAIPPATSSPKFPLPNLNPLPFLPVRPTPPTLPQRLVHPAPRDLLQRKSHFFRQVE